VYEYVIDTCSNAEVVAVLCGGSEDSRRESGDSAAALVRVATELMELAPPLAPQLWSALTQLFKSASAQSELAMTLGPGRPGRRSGLFISHSKLLCYGRGA
jgi:hypothetical protein